MPSPQSDIRRYLHTGEHNLLFASWPGDHLLDRAKRGDADLRRALIRVVEARTARVTVAVCEELADLDCAAFAHKKFAPMVRGLLPVPIARLPHPNTIETVLNKEDPRTAWDPSNMYLLSGGAKILSDDAPHGCEFALGRVVGTL